MWVIFAVIGVAVGYRLANKQTVATPTPSQALTGQGAANNAYRLAPVAQVQPQVPGARTVGTDEFVAPVAVDVTSQILVEGLFA